MHIIWISDFAFYTHTSFPRVHFSLYTYVPWQLQCHPDAITLKPCKSGKLTFSLFQSCHKKSSHSASHAWKSGVEANSEYVRKVREKVKARQTVEHIIKCSDIVEVQFGILWLYVSLPVFRCVVEEVNCKSAGRRYCKCEPVCAVLNVDDDKIHYGKRQMRSGNRNGLKESEKFLSNKQQHKKRIERMTHPASCCRQELPFHFSLSLLFSLFLSLLKLIRSFL